MSSEMKPGLLKDDKGKEFLALAEPITGVHVAARRPQMAERLRIEGLTGKSLNVIGIELADHKSVRTRPDNIWEQTILLVSLASDEGLTRRLRLDILHKPGCSLTEELRKNFPALKNEAA
jgi:hypothetical protein